MWARLNFFLEFSSHSIYTLMLLMMKIWSEVWHFKNCLCTGVVITMCETLHLGNISFVCVFDFVAGCCPRRAENPECIAPEGADGGASRGRRVRAINWQGEESTAAASVRAREHPASAEGWSLKRISTCTHSHYLSSVILLFLFFSMPYPPSSFYSPYFEKTSQEETWR